MDQAREMVLSTLKKMVSEGIITEGELDVTLRYVDSLLALDDSEALSTLLAAPHILVNYELMIRAHNRKVDFEKASKMEASIKAHLEHLPEKTSIQLEGFYANLLAKNSPELSRKR